MSTPGFRLGFRFGEVWALGFGVEGLGFPGSGLRLSGFCCTGTHSRFVERFGLKIQELGIEEGSDESS